MFFSNLLNYNDVGLLILRFAIGAIFIYHALPKFKNSSSMGAAMGLPGVFVFLLGTVECLSGIGMMIGFGVQGAALLLALVMVGALYFKMIRWHVPFAARDKTGWEFDLILLAANIALLLGGGGSVGIS